MIHAAKNLNDYRIRATDGDIGRVEDVYFDDTQWVIRYVMVNTGGWLLGRKVLISPYAVRALKVDKGVVAVDLTRAQVEGGPDLGADEPVSRHYETEYHRYYGYPTYWPYGTTRPWGVLPGVAPLDVSSHANQWPPMEHEESPTCSADSHLRSAQKVRGYHIQALDASVGHVEDILFDDESWAIRYLAVDARNWLPGKHVIVSPEWLRETDWNTRTVRVALKRAEIERSPPYDPDALPSREYERALHRHYAKPG